MAKNMCPGCKKGTIIFDDDYGYICNNCDLVYNVFDFSMVKKRKKPPILSRPLLGSFIKTRSQEGQLRRLAHLQDTISHSAQYHELEMRLLRIDERYGDMFVALWVKGKRKGMLAGERVALAKQIADKFGYGLFFVSKVLERRGVWKGAEWDTGIVRLIRRYGKIIEGNWKRQNGPAWVKRNKSSEIVKVMGRIGNLKEVRLSHSLIADILFEMELYRGGKWRESTMSLQRYFPYILWLWEGHSGDRLNTYEKAELIIKIAGLVHLDEGDISDKSNKRNSIKKKSNKKGTLHPSWVAGILFENERIDNFNHYILYSIAEKAEAILSKGPKRGIEIAGELKVDLSSVYKACHLFVAGGHFGVRKIRTSTYFFLPKQESLVDDAAFKDFPEYSTYRIIENHLLITSDELSTILSMNKDTVQTHLRKLRALGRITRLKRHRTQYYYCVKGREDVAKEQLILLEKRGN